MAVSDPRKSLIEFPCRFPIKAMGLAGQGFEDLILEIVGRHAPDVDAADLSIRSSRGGKWISVTVTIEAHNQPQLDAIYRELSAHELVVWAL